jgi:hypothetical protein
MSGWDLSPWSEVGRNDSNDRLSIPGPYPLSDRWLTFWLTVYRVKRRIKQLWTR